jgi:hypothetical protein
MGMLQFLKRSLFTLFFLGMAFRMAAQDQQYFVYIQSERSQPFYVRYDGKLIPSSDRGYIILSKMPAGTASLRIGFAKSDAPERQYLVKVTGPGDQGYLLKRDGDRGYALFNLQTFAVIRPGEDKNQDAVAAETPAAEVAPAQETAPAPAVAANETETAPTPAADTSVVPAPPVPVSDEEQKQAMMASLKKDLDSTFPTKSGVAVGPGTRPVKQSNRFSQALDKVVSDDRPDDIQLEEPKAPVAAAPVADTPAKVAPAVDAPVNERKRRRRRDRDPLTEEEKALASAVLAEENKAGATAPVQEQPITEVTPAAVPPVTEGAPATATPVGETAKSSEETVPASAEPVKEETPAPTKKEKKQRKKKNEDPAFIDFVDTGGHQAPPAGSVAAPAPATTETTPTEATVIPAEEAPVSAKKKKRSKVAEKLDTIDASERPNNVVNDPTGYAVTDLSIDHPKESKKDKKKKKAAEGEAVDIAAPVAAEPVPETKSSSLKMINSDCGKVMDDETFRKVLRKFVAGKDDDAMLDAFRRQTKGYCLESSQIKTLVQLMGTDESRYRLLDQAYPKAYHSDEYAGLESLLSDNYYKKRFRAMLNR